MKYGTFFLDLDETIVQFDESLVFEAFKGIDRDLISKFKNTFNIAATIKEINFKLEDLIEEVKQLSGASVDNTNLRETLDTVEKKMIDERVQKSLVYVYTEELISRAKKLKGNYDLHIDNLLEYAAFVKFIKEFGTSFRDVVEQVFYQKSTA